MTKLRSGSAIPQATSRMGVDTGRDASTDTRMHCAAGAMDSTHVWKSGIYRMEGAIRCACCTVDTMASSTVRPVCPCKAAAPKVNTGSCSAL